MNLENLSYEESIKALEGAIEKLKSKDLKLEESIVLFKEANNYYEHCNKLLNDAEGKIKLIVEENGVITEEDFDLE